MLIKDFQQNFQFKLETIFKQFFSSFVLKFVNVNLKDLFDPFEKDLEDCITANKTEIRVDFYSNVCWTVHDVELRKINISVQSHKGTLRKHNANVRLAIRVGPRLAPSVRSSEPLDQYYCQQRSIFSLFPSVTLFFTTFCSSILTFKHF